MSSAIEQSFAKISIITNTTNNFWIKEINSDGLLFDYDSQDIYRAHLENVYSLNYKEKIKTHSDSLFMKLAPVELPKILKTNIDLYEKYESLFESYDRNKLQIDTYRKLTKSIESDEELNIQIMNYTEKMNRDKYYNSSYYKDFGFLTTNFHYYIYLFNKKLLKDFENNFQDYSKYDSNYIFINKVELFSMDLIFKLHQETNNELFETIKITDFYDELNFFHSINKIKIKPKQNNKVYYVIYMLSCLLNDKELKNNWLDAILFNLELKKTSYSSKYLNIKQIDSLQDFVNRIDNIFNIKN